MKRLGKQGSILQYVSNWTGLSKV